MAEAQANDRRFITVGSGWKKIKGNKKNKVEFVSLSLDPTLIGLQKSDNGKINCVLVPTTEKRSVKSPDYRVRMGLDVEQYEKLQAALEAGQEARAAAVAEFMKKK